MLPMRMSYEVSKKETHRPKPVLQDGLTSNAVWAHYDSIAGYGRPCVSTPMIASKAHLTF
jgi:hypothetical protein